MTYIAEPLTRKQLRQLAFQIRQLIGFENKPRFPVIVFLENIMPMIFPGFYYEIATESELGASKHGDTDVANKCIRIREDVYIGALEGNGRDRMTVAHEIAHYILLVVCGIKFARTFAGYSVPTYQDPEWQAKALSGELMCAAHLIVKMSPQSIVDECGVSDEAAVYQLKKARGGAIVC
ncbi:MAG: ImmA/IrrE family metallo-endopeptidase [Defluviitaleaceae bacterium]|nr:ImmA/IrrE family metallo-endopeptidase [Defluviitaleaceae bacterium]